MGGIGSLILNIADYSRLCGDGDKVQFEYLVSGTSAYIPVLENKGYRFYMAPKFSQIRDYRRFLRALFEKEKYDYLWFNNTSKVNTILPAYAKKYAGAKIITHSHGVAPEEKGLKKMAFTALDALHRRRMFQLCDVPFACSQEAADIYYKYSGALRDQVLVVRNGILASGFKYSPEDRERVRAELGIDSGEICLGAVGRLAHVKNYPFIISLLPELPDKYKLVIVGEGEDRAEMEALIRGLNLDSRCILIGRRSDVPAFLSAMDVFLLPSFHEGMPYSIIEAQANGLPCIVSDTLSQELKLTDLVIFESIQDSRAWVRRITAAKTAVDRAAMAGKIREKGYDIGETYRSIMEKLR
ncbi:MAG: glycosyltransferase [Oscillospiraceae bacterium]|nr:glycosyltransferase [Oscillospiraceae bacterium]